MGIEQPAIEQPGEPLQERVEPKVRGFREMVGDQSDPYGCPRRRVPLRMAVRRGQREQAGPRAAHRLVLPISAHIQPGHPQVVAMTEAVMLQRSAFERVKECVVVHGHTVDSPHFRRTEFPAAVAALRRRCENARQRLENGLPAIDPWRPSSEGRFQPGQQARPGLVAHHSEYVGNLIVRPSATARCGVRPSAPERR